MLQSTVQNPEAESEGLVSAFYSRELYEIFILAKTMYGRNKDVIKMGPSLRAMIILVSGKDLLNWNKKLLLQRCF